MKAFEYGRRNCFSAKMSLHVRQNRRDFAARLRFYLFNVLREAKVCIGAISNALQKYKIVIILKPFARPTLKTKKIRYS